MGATEVWGGGGNLGLQQLVQTFGQPRWEGQARDNPQGIEGKTKSRRGAGRVVGTDG